jgi:hypothetical protein
MENHVFTVPNFIGKITDESEIQTTVSLDLLFNEAGSLSR